MAEIVNLNKFRKQRERDATRQSAEENRIRHGRTKAERGKAGRKPRRPQGSRRQADRLIRDRPVGPHAAETRSVRPRRSSHRRAPRFPGRNRRTSRDPRPVPGGKQPCLVDGERRGARLGKAEATRRYRRKADRPHPVRDCQPKTVAIASGEQRPFVGTDVRQIRPTSRPPLPLRMMPRNGKDLAAGKQIT